MSQLSTQVGQMSSPAQQLGKHQQEQQEQEQSPQQQLSENDPRRRRRVCLFGLSADPPTGVGGHYSIVQALCTLRRQVLPRGTNGTRDREAATHEFQSTEVAPNSLVHASVDGESESDDVFPLAPYMFDEVWVLPVYRHTFQVRCYHRALAFLRLASRSLVDMACNHLVLSSVLS
jgi:hypothetical protein